MISLNVNGKQREVDVSPDTPLLWVIRETLGMTGTKFGCGHSAVRRLHRASGWHSSPLLQHSSLDGCREEDYDHRRPLGRFHARPATGMDHRAGAPVRLLPVWTDHVGSFLAGPQPQPHRRGHQQRHVGQHLPVRDLPAHPPCHSPRGANDPSGGVTWAQQRISQDEPSSSRSRGGRWFGDRPYLPGLLKPAKGQVGVFAPNIWLRIAPDDSVTVLLTQIEMGQGVMTAMPMLVAEDLDADWNKVKLEWVGADKAYGNVNMDGDQTTAASQSVRGYWKPMREAGAAARAMLVTAAAQTWGVPEESLSTEKGVVTHTASGRHLRYGELVEKAATLPVPEQVSLKDPNNFRLLGQPRARRDIPAKVNGSATFGMDVKVPNMLIARILRCPVFGGRVASFSAEKTRTIPGVRHVMEISILSFRCWRCGRCRHVLGGHEGPGSFGRELG